MFLQNAIFIKSSDLAIKQKVTVFIIATYCLLVQQLQLSPIPQFIESIPEKKLQIMNTNSIKLQYISANHVVGFGSSQVLIGSRTHALTMSLSGAKKVEPIVQDQGQDLQPGKNTSHNASSETQPFTSAISYTHPWTKVSAVYKPSTDGIIKSEYHIESGFNKQTIKQIRIQYNRPIELDKNGGLIIKYAFGTMQESPPIAWQEINGQRNYVEVKYKKLGEQEIGFQVKGYDPNYSLIIDPTLTWNTFIGGTGNDYGMAIAVDGSDNVVVGGYSDVNWGSPIRGYSSGKDGFVAKLDSGGNLLWNTFLGGSGDDYGMAIAVDGGANVVVGGYSYANWGSPIRVYSSGADSYAAKLDSSGNLLWHTFLGSASNDYGSAIAVDGSNNIVIGGHSNATWGSPVRAYIGGPDGYAAKLDSGGNLLWNTFIGGAGTDVGHAIAVDGSNNVVVSGYSNSFWGSPIRGYSGLNDGYVAKLDSSGNLLWHTFLGGTSVDYGTAVAVDGSANVLVGGYSVATWGSPIRGYIGGPDGYAAKLDSSGNLLWHTFLGGAGVDEGTAIAVDGSDNVVVGGYSTATWGSPIRGYISGNDGFSAKLDSGGNLLWNGFLGGSGTDEGNAIAFDGSANVVVAGSSDATWGSPIIAFSGLTDTYIAKITEDNITPTTTYTITATGTPTSTSTSTHTPTATPTISPTSTHTPTATLTISPTSTYSPSATPTDSPTSTHTLTATPTASPTSTHTLTATPTISPTSTHTLTVTPTDSPTSTQTPTATPTASPTSTHTLTATPTISPTSTHTPTATPTISLTSTHTPTATPTISLTSTHTPTATPTISPTSTHTPTATLTISPTSTPTPTPTDSPTLTHTLTVTPTVSPTSIHTLTVTPTASPTSIYTLTITPTDSPTSTHTLTATPTDSPTSTQTLTATPTISLTSTNTPTVTPTDSPTSTCTSTATPTGSPTPIGTFTTSPTPTSDYSSTPTPSITLTRTSTPTLSTTPILSSTPTVTVTPTFSPSPTQTISSLTSILSNLIIYPNPFRAPSQQVTIQYLLNADADVSITIYTYLGAKMKSITVRAGEAGGQGNPTGQINQVTWDGRNSQGLLQATGGYICQIVARSNLNGKQEKITNKIGLIR